MKKEILVLAAGLALSTGVAAQEQPGFYLGASLGMTETDAGPFIRDITDALTSAGFSNVRASAEESAVTYKALAGYQINRNLAVEVFYAGLGSYSGSAEAVLAGTNRGGDAKVEVSAMGIDLLGKVPFDRNVSGFAKIGVFQWESKTTAAAAGRTATSENDGTDVKVGLGIDYMATPNVRVRLEGEYYNMKYSTFEDLGVGVLTVGLLYQF
jgi:OOP family OmpA-OmpF porin